MTRIYLIRHAEAEGNLYRIAQGQYDSALTDRGWRQVRALERRFADVHIDAVYSSDLYRTCATASALYLPKNLPLRRRRDLREIHVGAWEQRTWGDIIRTDAEQMKNFGQRPDLWQVEGAERPQAVLDRAMAALRDIAGENRGRTVAVFSHGYVIRLTLAALQGFSIQQLAQTPVGDNTAVSLLEVDEAGALRVVFRDDNSHLQAPEFLAGEKVRRRANGLEPGLYFEPLRLPEQEELLHALSGELAAPAGPALVGFLQGEPVGLVAFGDLEDRAGRIALAFVREDFRRRGFGVQLIGQAVQHWRPLGAEALRLTLPAGSAARQFFLDYGFQPSGESPAAGETLEKSIAYDPAFLFQDSTQ